MNLRTFFFSHCAKYCLLCSDFGIITKPRPGDQFVSIDGKKTYFEIGPTAAPTAPFAPPLPPKPPPLPPRGGASKPLPGRGEVIGATLQIGGQNRRSFLMPNSFFNPVYNTVNAVDLLKAVVTRPGYSACYPA
jgi:hypothetical protein